MRFSYRQGVATFSVDTVRSEPALKRFRFHVDVWSGVHFDPVTRSSSGFAVLVAFWRELLLTFLR
jgi:hypothetical protein